MNNYENAVDITKFKLILCVGHPWYFFELMLLEFFFVIGYVKNINVCFDNLVN
jgi:hypothetical protein